MGEWPKRWEASCRELLEFEGAGLPSQVWVWTAEVGVSREKVGELLELLDGREKDKALRYRDGKRESYVLAHALRRSLLAACLGADPRELTFSADSTGYPSPIADGNDQWFHSLSHSGRYTAVAAAANRRLGVDIERPRAIHHADELAAMVLPSGANRADANILAAWVRWEALTKATGEGLARPLHPLPDRLTASGRLWRVHSLPHPSAHLAVVLTA
ncbi:MAG: 4'-phosphopantetheinyl transferase family protein [Pseudonocardiaceae bacterium]